MSRTWATLGVAVGVGLAVVTAGCGAPAASPPAPETVTVTAPAPVEPRPASAAATPAAGGTPRCTTAGLSATLGEGDAAAGSVTRPLVFTNTGAAPCELRGFPGVSYVAGADGHQVGPAAQETGERAGEVVLRPGGKAQALVQFVQVANFDAAVCQPTPVRGLRVYPPGDTASLFVAADGTGCAGTPPGPQLSVRTVTAV
ncbi:MAG TPA: DUF4232 domain-containing protein [Geodermatophilus sp.]|nr:DUF4232 domain-containing protein [Geodermatophilus sp.]